MAILIIIAFFFLISFIRVLGYDSNIMGQFTGVEVVNPVVTCPYNQQHIRGECCLDTNNNNICDREEWSINKPTSGRDKDVVSIVKVTTTTIQEKTKCRKNVDCGLIKEYNKCIGEKLYSIRETPTCIKPGRKKGRCVNTITKKIFKKCGRKSLCIEDKCVKKTKNKNTIQNIKEKNIPVTTISTEPSNCIDTDGGFNYYVRGNCSLPNSKYPVIDYCSETNVYECYCQGPDKLGGVLYACPVDCVAGKCITTTTIK